MWLTVIYKLRDASNGGGPPAYQQNGYDKLRCDAAVKSQHHRELRVMAEVARPHLPSLASCASMYCLILGR